MKISKTMFSEKENATYPDIVQVLIGDYAKLFMQLILVLPASNVNATMYRAVVTNFDELPR